MNQREEITLGLLKAKPYGVTCYDFPKGLHYKDAILHLRAQGYKIDMVMENDKQINRKIGRYFYKGKGLTSQMPKVVKESKKDKARDLAFKLMTNKKLDGETRILLTQIFNLLR
jgi:hypothetical protein